ncbi:hypothetical protein SBA4_6460007 [Candidatus Sulfopaludibacter sp. SbA4]|nr:hypothetical protein SBA4_6460007 [Candidatus Sulfopaludibacter sp. SbA4]
MSTTRRPSPPVCDASLEKTLPDASHASQTWETRGAQKTSPPVSRFRTTSATHTSKGA